MKRIIEKKSGSRNGRKGKGRVGRSRMDAVREMSGCFHVLEVTANASLKL
jgi:hypothetical protein